MAILSVNPMTGITLGPAARSPNITLQRVQARVVQNNIQQQAQTAGALSVAVQQAPGERLDTVTLGDNTQVLRSDFDKLSKDLQSIATSKGLGAVNAAIAKQNETAATAVAQAKATKAAEAAQSQAAVPETDTTDVDLMGRPVAGGKTDAVIQLEKYQVAGGGVDVATLVKEKGHTEAVLLLNKAGYEDVGPAVQSAMTAVREEQAYTQTLNKLEPYKAEGGYNIADAITKCNVPQEDIDKLFGTGTYQEQLREAKDYAQWAAQYTPTEVKEIGHPANSTMVGWYDSDFAYLSPDMAYAEIMAAVKRGNIPFTWQADGIWTDLKRMGWTECEPGRTTKIKKVRGKVVRLVWLRQTALLGDEQADEK